MNVLFYEDNEDCITLILRATYIKRTTEMSKPNKSGNEAPQKWYLTEKTLAADVARGARNQPAYSSDSSQKLQLAPSEIALRQLLGDEACRRALAAFEAESESTAPHEMLQRVCDELGLAYNCRKFGSHIWIVHLQPAPSPLLFSGLLPQIAEGAALRCLQRVLQEPDPTTHDSLDMSKDILSLCQVAAPTGRIASGSPQTNICHNPY